MIDVDNNLFIPTHHRPSAGLTSEKKKLWVITKKTLTLLYDESKSTVLGRYGESIAAINVSRRGEAIHAVFRPTGSMVVAQFTKTSQLIFPSLLVIAHMK